MSLLAMSIAAAADGHNPFTGFYGGAESGLESMTFNGANEKYISYAFFGGYRYQMNSGLVAGVEVYYGENDYNSWGGFDESDLSVGHTKGAMAVLGYALGSEQKSLLFGKLGYSRTDFDVTGWDSGVTTSDSESGLLFGGGYEYKLWEFMSFRVAVDRVNTGMIKQTRVTIGGMLTF